MPINFVTVNKTFATNNWQNYHEKIPYRAFSVGISTFQIKHVERVRGVWNLCRYTFLNIIEY